MLPSQMHLSLLFLISKLSLLLSHNSLQLSLTGCLGLRTLGVHLLLDDSLTRLLGFGFVDLSHHVSLLPL